MVTFQIEMIWKNNTKYKKAFNKMLLLIHANMFMKLFKHACILHACTYQMAQITTTICF